jgi:putative membrane protein
MLGRSGAFVLLLLGLAPSAAFGADNSFLNDAVQGDNSEIALGSLAAIQASSAGVRQFGQTLVADHTKAKAEVESVANSRHMTPATGEMPEARTEADKLKTLKGADFDREFVNYMVDDHRKDIAKFEAEAARKDGAVSDLAAKQLPTLRKHLSIAASLQKKQ